MFRLRAKTSLPDPADAPPGRPTPLIAGARHVVNDRPLDGPYPAGARTLVVGMGCFWGAERLFWRQPGVWVTSVGYAGGRTPNPTYEEVCSGASGHAEVVNIVHRPDEIALETLLRLFWEGHDPTQGMRQGADVGTQYRSVLFVTPEQRDAALASRALYQERLTAAGFGPITTEIAQAPAFYPAELHHQQYLARNPQGYCGVGGDGVACPNGLGVARADAQ